MNDSKWKVPDLNEQDYITIIKNCNYDELLMPIKKENRRYFKYRKYLGNLSKKSKLVQMNLPSFVAELYKNRDPAYVKIIEKNIKRFQDELIPDMEEAVGRKLTKKEIENFSPNQLVEILKRHAQSRTGSVDLDLFQVQLKMNGISLSDEDKAQIRKLFFKDNEQEDHEELTKTLDPSEQIKKIPEQNRDNVPEKGKIKKAKKLTADEKAEKNRLALERKRKQQMERDLKDEDEKYYENNITASSEQKTIDAHGFNEEQIIMTPYKDKEYTSYDEKHIFVGYIDIRGYTPEYYNFQPIGLLENGKFVFTKKTELESMLPDSEFGNINLKYEFSTEINYISDRLHQDQLMLLEVSIKDLKDNITPSGERNRTGYYIPCKQAFIHHQLRYLYEDGLYRLITPTFTLDDIAAKKIAYLSKDIDYELTDGEKILLRMGNKIFGPLEVKVSQQISDKYIINPKIAEHEYIVYGYENNNIHKETVEEDPEREYGTPIYENYYRINDDALYEVIDVIPDNVLMNSLKDFMKTNSMESIPDTVSLGAMDLNVFKGKYVTDQIRQRRVDRIISLLKDQDKIKEYSSQIVNALYQMISEDKDSELSTEIIDTLLESHPELTDQIQSSRLVTEQIKAQRRELEDLKVQKENILQETEEQKKAVQNKEIDKEIEEKKLRLNELKEKISQGEEYQNLVQKINDLKKEAEYQDNHNYHLREDTKGLESTFLNVIHDYSNRIANITLDGYISNKMLEAAAKWEAGENEDKYLSILDNEKNEPKVPLNPEDLIDYVVRVIQRVRPNYDRNTIINLLICTTQGFLTILSGEPGNGKTSLCNILGKALGLTKNDPPRYIQVSVERGWTSKRDFVGYYNPLTKSFEENNHAVYDGLELLDLESRNNINRYPFLILLDEANLSPMEYYWADFMNVCDDQMDNHTVNLGSEHTLQIPETLHFIATINNDHTTEALSPRLVDRAFIVTLPKAKIINYSNYDISDEVKKIEWKDLKRTFSVPTDEIVAFNGEIQRVYEDILNCLGGQNIQISARTDIAIHRYWAAASNRMESDKNNNDPGIIALDYAVAQKILPKIQGSGEEFGSWLESFEEMCRNNNLIHSMQIIEDIKDRGKNNMNYYQFFA